MTTVQITPISAGLFGGTRACAINNGFVARNTGVISGLASAFSRMTSEGNRLFSCAYGKVEPLDAIPGIRVDSGAESWKTDPSLVDICSTFQSC